MNDIVLIQRPLAEPVSVIDLMTQMGMNIVSDPTLNATLSTQLAALLLTARADCENYTQRAFITQTWLLRRDSFPGHNLRYEWNGYPQIDLPKPPFQSVGSFTYIDVSGTPQVLTIDTTFGTNPANPQYGYQLDRGSETQPARLLPPFARPWPPTRLVPSNVMVQFRCGYGGPLIVSTTEGSPIITGPKFNPDDAPLLPLETGLAVCIPGAGPVVDGVASALVTNIASVDVNGQATLAADAAAAVTKVPGWFGSEVPTTIRQAILFLAQWYYEQGSIVDQPLPRMVRNLLEPYRNLVA